MKFFVAFALIVAVASASFNYPGPASSEVAQIQEIIAAIQSPSTNPATAAALQQMLFDLLGLTPQPIAVGPAIIEQTPVGGPAIVPVPEIIDVTPVVVAPGPVAEAPVASAPLVQIILNINQAGSSPVGVSPVEVIDNTPVTPVDVVETAPEQPINIIDVMPVVVPNLPVIDVMPVVVPNPPMIDVMPVVVPASPVHVVETAPVAVEPVLIGTPIIPSPAVILPEQLN